MPVPVGARRQRMLPSGKMPHDEPRRTRELGRTVTGSRRVCEISLPPDDDGRGQRQATGDGDHPRAAMTSSAVITAATFCMAYWTEARCQSAFIVEQQSCGTTTK